MAFTDPQSLTINSIATSVPRTEVDNLKSIYTSADGNVKLTISHQPAADRTRHMIRADQRIVASDPLTAVNAYKNLGVYLVIDQPNFGFSATTINYLVAALTAWLSSTNVGKVVGGES